MIRLAFIDDRMGQLRSVVRIAKPYFPMLHTVKSDTLALRRHFSLIEQAVQRARELVAEMERAFGESLDTIAGVPLPPETVAHNIDDPTRPQGPDPTLDRPPEASNYR